MSRVLVLDLVAPRVYLAGIDEADSPQTLKQYGITHVVSAMLGTNNLPTLDKRLNTLHISINDNRGDNIAKYFKRVIKFIQDALDADKENKVLVHCREGKSRSATLVCAYLITTQGMSAAKAIAHVKERREQIAPNDGFMGHLIAWEGKMKKKLERRRKLNSGTSYYLSWMGKAKSAAGEAKTQAAHVQTPEGVHTKPESVSSGGGGDHK